MSAAPHLPSVEQLAAALRAAVKGQVDVTTLTRGMYATDASNYRVVPQAVVYPVDGHDLARVADVARGLGVPLTMRGAGTSCAGNAIGPGVVVDTSRHLTRILDINPESRKARVEPGVVLDALQTAARPFGLRFGPDPSTHSRCTIGGMIGNNACGNHAIAYGRTSDNVEALELIDGHGRHLRAGTDLSAVPGLQDLVDQNLATLRTEFGRFGRQVSGYGLEHLLPEKNHRLAKALVGSEGTCGLVTEATVRLVPLAAAPVLVVLGYADMAQAADAVPALLPLNPLALEGMDARLVDGLRRAKGAGSVPPLPDGAAWLMLEFDTVETAQQGASLAMETASPALAVRVLRRGPEASAMWRIREDGAGLGGRTPSGNQAWPGFEDAAVPPARLGSYLRAMEGLLQEFGLEGLPYGHLGDGCVHIRIDFPFDRDTTTFRDFMTAAARLVVDHEGSLSGEHGDGRARSELLAAMYSPTAQDIMAQFKDLFDPDGLLNPGVIVAPAALDDHLRRPAARPQKARRGFQFREDGGDLTKAVHRCTGVGKCHADVGAFMCPSYLASLEEKDSTRGRARVLQELANGSLIGGGFAAPELAEALSLCLACKACSSDCPAGVDMARLKSESLYRRYAGHLRPRVHYLLGWLPRWTRLATKMPWAANLVLHAPLLGKAVLRAGGMDSRRSLPRFAARGFAVQAADAGWPPLSAGPGGGLAGGVGQPSTADDVGAPSAGTPFWGAQTAGAPTAGAPTAGAPSGETPTAEMPGVEMPDVETPGAEKPPAGPVLLWADSFSSTLAPEIDLAVAEVLSAAGYQVFLVPPDVCCGLTWITTGQLRGAKKHLSALMDTLGPFAVNGVPIVGVEPSCTAVLRSDLLDLLPDDPRAAAVAAHTHTLAELLKAAKAAGHWRGPALAGTKIIVQPHCHHHSVMGYQADLDLLRGLGAQVKALAGCCGMAGNFGMEKGRYEMSLAVARRSLLPALAEAPEGAVFLADGFSCRTQAADLAGVQGKHLAQVLLEAAASDAA
ncbi:MAG: FAD-binding protein [Bifidobacteriaceae bacterium]|jgi:FAD/FMN-containing dehydrogenase/Fe-S oxidoreductase|nr:FAD-binding protein [Bifidobacteriaceae bacterium]